MTVTLTEEQEAWLNAHVAAGDFASVEDGARRLINDGISERALMQDDLRWAVPFVREGDEDARHGRVISLEEHERRNDGRFARG